MFISLSALFGKDKDIVSNKLFLTLLIFFSLTYRKFAHCYSLGIIKNGQIESSRVNHPLYIG